MPFTVEELTQNPETIPFSRLKYLARRDEREVAEFFHSLFLLSAEAKDSGDWRQVEHFLEEWEERLVGSLRVPLSYEASPWAPLSKPLNRCRVALITTGGLYVEGQEPFNVAGDWSFRHLPKDSLILKLSRGPSSVVRPCSTTGMTTK